MLVLVGLSLVNSTGQAILTRRRAMAARALDYAKAGKAGGARSARRNEEVKDVKRGCDTRIHGDKSITPSTKACINAASLWLKARKSQRGQSLSSAVSGEWECSCVRDAFSPSCICNTAAIRTVGSSRMITSARERMSADAV